jgi:ABC-type cobalamin/Fe3+-siderophores transport system ATPase subunit
MMLKAENLTAGYGKGFCLKGINADMPRKALTGIIGPNGSGKTTLLKSLGGYIKPFEGGVFIDGADIHSLDAGQRGRNESIKRKSDSNR